jgi:hypothetical protein
VTLEASSKVSDGYVGKSMKSEGCFNWSALEDDFRTFLIGRPEIADRAIW